MIRWNVEALVNRDMNDKARIPGIERTAEQKADERRIREMHRQNPIREVPADAISGADVVVLMRLVAAIRRERETQGLTFEAIAERACMKASAYARLESGNVLNPSLSTLFRITGALGKSLVLELATDLIRSEIRTDDSEQDAVRRFSRRRPQERDRKAQTDD
jgi:transcriptional regulator with XRE-family HTH domain